MSRDSRLFLLWPAVAMSLGWGLRGYIGGGSFGAMIPGALVALVLCRLLAVPPARAALVAAFGAVGIGFGGEMTYGQTVGFVRETQAAAWGLLGLAIKGGVWGLLGGAVLGAGFALDVFRSRRLPWALVALVTATALGWALVNQPKLIYFSNLADRPREEVWFGLLAGALAWLAVFGGRSAWEFGLAGLVGGFVGFGGGGLWIYAGALAGQPYGWVPWWKLMEFTFGACFGLALAFATLRLAEAIRAGRSRAAGHRGGVHPAAAVLWMTVLSAAVLAGGEYLPVRFGFVLVGAILLAMAAYLPNMRWPIALGLTAAAFFTDWAEDHAANPVAVDSDLAWALAVLACLIFFVVVARASSPPPLLARRAYWLLLSAAMLTAWIKGLTTNEYSRGLAAEQALFAVLLGILLLIEWRCSPERLPRYDSLS